MARLSPDALDARVREILDAYKVPGAAVSVLVDGKPLYRASPGVMSVRSAKPVTDSATFDIGSVSKTFNAAAVALLVEEGRFGWDTRAIDLLPEFRLSDPTLTPHVTVRDLLGQAVGFGEDNITNYNSRFSRDEIVRQCRFLPLRARFRQECAYQQYGPVVASTLVDKLTGRSWEDFVEDRVCGALALKETYATYFRMRDRSIACDLHMDLGDGRMSAFPHRNFDALAPAGAMVSSQRDMEVWFTAFACGGMAGGKRLLKPETVEALLEPGVPVRRDGIHPQRWYSRYEANFVTYGMGWYAHDFAGRRINEHTGALEGFLVMGCAVPQDKIAVVILTNQHQSSSVHALRYLLLSHGLGVEQKDWDARYRAVSGSARRGARMIDGQPYFWRPLDRQEGTKPSWPLERLAGDFVHEGFGSVPVRVVDGKLHIDVVGNPCVAEHWHHDLFRAVPDDPAIRSYHQQIFCRFETGHGIGPNVLDIPTIGQFARSSAR